MRRKRPSGLGSAALGLGTGLLLGLLLLQRPSEPPLRTTTAPPVSHEAAEVKFEAKPRELLYVGVMTARKYLGSRARAVFESWGAEVPGRIGFYSSEGSQMEQAAEGLPLIALPRVDDSYPPQKKSFLMLQHMWQQHGERFEWFLRADDDLYVRTDRLEKLLRSVDSRRALYIGQAGRGNSEEFGLLSLEYDENFCMGGPGVLISRETLRRVVPHIKYCLANLYTSHEDVELGRCVRKFAGISCTWSYEMQSILYHNSSGDLAFTGKLKSREVHRAISLHPVKNPPHMYRLHNYMRGLKIQDLQQKRLELNRDIAKMTSILSTSKSKNNEITGLTELKERGHWDFVSRSEFSLGDSNPRRRLHSDLREGLEDLTREVMASINACSRQRGRFVEERQALYGYRRRTAQGVDTVLDLLLIYRKYRGRKITLPVRRHLYLHQHFTGLEWRTSEDSKSDGQTIHFLVPVAGRLEALLRFVNNFEQVCLQNPKEVDRTTLTVILYSRAAEPDPSRELLLQMQTEYGKDRIRILDGQGSFSRARALDQAVRTLSENDLMFFVDVDIRFGTGALLRLRRNCVLGRRAYFPVVFSQYDPAVVGAEKINVLNSRTGFWRIFGFGIAAMYRRDYEAVGGFDLDIRGWGKEDVDLFEKTVRSDMEVFRAADRDLVHAYHGVKCDNTLESLQYSMCKGTRADTYAGIEQLAAIVYDNPIFLQYAKAKRAAGSVNASSAPAG